MKRNHKNKCYFEKAGFTPAPIYITIAGVKKIPESALVGFRNTQPKCKLVRGFTLAEAIATLAITAMIMVAVVGIYMGIKRAEAAVNRRLGNGFLSMEIMQRIADDIGKLSLPGSSSTMSVKNKIDIGGYKVSQMIIENKIYGKDNKPQTFEKIIWQSRVDTDANGLVVYRSHSGYAFEDKMLEEPKEQYERELFIPICSGAKHFSIEAVVDGNTVEEWQGTTLPPAVKISMSFADREPDLLGNITVPQEMVQTRTVVINRFKQISYQFIPTEFPDMNGVADMNQPKEPNKSVDTNNMLPRE
jgi:type II secretory pathway component PulJ